MLINGTELQSRMLDETSSNVTNRTTPGICSGIKHSITIKLFDILLEGGLLSLFMNWNWYTLRLRLKSIVVFWTLSLYEVNKVLPANAMKIICDIFSFNKMFYSLQWFCFTEIGVSSAQKLRPPSMQCRATFRSSIFTPLRSRTIWTFSPSLLWLRFLRF